MLYQDNPFRLLGVLPTDGRREIVRQAEEKALLLDAQRCSDARTMLTNPQRRIDAEIHWFLDCTAKEIDEIDAYITGELSDNRGNDFSWEKKNVLTQLNIQLACLDAQNFNNHSSAKFYILGISRMFESIDTDQVQQLINVNRQQAGFPEVTKTQDIDDAFNEMRSEIRRMLSSVLQSQPADSYTKIVTTLSESYSGSRRYKGNAVLEDVISDYQLYINDELHEQGQSIIKTAKFISIGANKIDVSRAVSDLIDRLYAWDELAQPLQLGALTKGGSHDESVEMLRTLRDLALKLHNDYSMSEESLAITKAVQEVFIELPEFAELLEKDNDALTRIVGDKEAEEAIGSLLDSIKDAYEVFKNCPENQRPAKLNNLISFIKGADTRIKTQFSDQEEADDLRRTLGMVARSFAIELHNDQGRTEDSIKIINAIEPLFSDIPDLSEMIEEDKTTLDNLRNEQKKTEDLLNCWKEVETLSDTLKNSYLGDRGGRINTLLSKTGSLDQMIKSTIQNPEERNTARENLAYMVRSVGIELHNNNNDSENALRVINGLKNIFSDMPQIMSVLNKDSMALSPQVGYRNISNAGNSYHNNTAVNTKQTKRRGRSPLGVIAFLLIIACVIYAINHDSSTTKTTSSSSTSKPATYSTPKPTATPKPTFSAPAQTMPANGYVFFRATPDKDSTFTVTNAGSAYYYMKFVKAGTNTPAIMFFVRPNSNVTIDMPAANLELRYAYAYSGSTWYGEKYLFGDDTHYAKDEDYYDFSHYTWEISLNTTLANGSMDMDVEYIDADEF